ncbi:MAG: M14 family metallopeptidase, partial [Gammaproteobacteria bacterium]|nr:M14 family metallopeptidase [Gammaproteobacteria bacterium]
MQFREHDALPEGLLECEASELLSFLGAPTLIHLAGAREPAMFVSVLLHGNEVSGWNGLRRLLTEFSTLPRSLSILIGNVSAAAQGMRALPGQQDYNRIWRNGVGEEGAMAREISASLAARPLLAAVDLHNNTGHNPHYSVVTDLSPENLGYAYLFSDKAVYIEEPDTVIAHIFAGQCPAITLELGPVSDPGCDERAYDYLKRCLELDEPPIAKPEDFRLYRTQVRVHVRSGVEFSFADEDLVTPLVLTAGVEGVNFHELVAGSPFGRVQGALADVLQVLDVDHQDVTERYFEL